MVITYHVQADRSKYFIQYAIIIKFMGGGIFPFVAVEVVSG